ncbi:type II secretion system secretin GspD [Comamonas sp.]|uniref:Type II secretion system secretin GspD n=2 Tax=Comamonadaceae TaxID=80864 RepID=A0ABY5ZVP3_9BURK|nr:MULTISPECIES: type II secretion system secretin GspD [Comamonas]UXC18037.1 type II secretion system secretin GspD [Comamonas sp. PR12]
MQYHSPIYRFALHSIAASVLLMGGNGAALAQTAINTGTASIRAGEPVTLNFANADIESIARTMATITGKSVVVDPRIKGTMNLVTDRPVSPQAAFEQFLAALRLQNYTVVEAAGLYKVVPEADAKLQGGTVRITQGGAGGQVPGGGQIVTQIFKLNFESANNLVPVLRPLISPNNTINVNPGNNSLVITDYADNLQRLSRIIASMDVANASDVEVVQLEHAVATDIVPMLQRLLEGGQTVSASGSATAGAAPGAAQTDNAYRTSVLADPRTNSILLRAANPARLSQAKMLIGKLDSPSRGGNASGNIHVVYLRNADATALATTLRAALAGQDGNSASPATNLSSSGSSGGLSSNTRSGATSLGGSTSGTLGNSASSSSAGGLGSGARLGTGTSLGTSGESGSATGGIIQADTATNSLIITAPEPLYRQIRSVIDQLDSRRAQVLVESLIVEVSAEKAAQFGVQWQSLLGQGNNVVGVIGNNFTVGGANLFNLAAGIANNTYSTLPSAGMNAGIAFKHNGEYVLGALANLLQSNADGNVLATPNLLTLDNQEAQILVGQNVPFVTGSYANSTGSSTVNPFTTVERKDVGLTLRVRPQINANGTVKLTIYQETSDVLAGTTTNANGPTTNKRSIESTVLVDDGSVIVIGGLLQDQYSGSVQKVPYLGDIPGIGALFRSDTRSRKKTNLMVFLRPVVMRDAAATQQVSMDRYELMRGAQIAAQPEQSTRVPINESSIITPLAQQTSGLPLGASETPVIESRPLTVTPQGMRFEP